MEEFKQKLARVFDDNLETNQWKNRVDYIIMGFIFLSTLEIYLSTYDSIVAQYGTILKFVNIATTLFFTVEVSLRIWCADLIDPRFKGFWGRVRYCFTLYGMIDVLSTYSFYITLIFPIPYMLLKVLRVVRLMRLFRYMKAFGILNKAVKSKKDEMVVSLQFLCIITLILSFVLFFVEHAAQPDVYDNGWTSVVWAFTQYIGDPGGFADTPPITFCGRLIACIIGVLGIAIFAVPAGLIASGFSEAMEEDKRDEDTKNWVSQVRLCFERKLDRPTGYQICPRFVSLPEIQARMALKSDEIIDAVNADPELRLTNLAITRVAEEKAEDKLAVEHFLVNRSYGYCVNRNSKVTIFSTSNNADPINGWWSYYLALFGGFNYVGREIGPVRPYKSLYLYDPKDPSQDRADFMKDMESLLDSEDKWVICINPTSGMNTSEYPTQFHFTYGGKKGDETYDDPDILLNDVKLFDALYQDFTEQISKFKVSGSDAPLGTDRQRYHGSHSPKLFARHLEHKVNFVSMFIAWSVSCWDSRNVQFAQLFANVIHNHIEPSKEIDTSAFKKKDIGFKGYN